MLLTHEEIMRHINPVVRNKYRWTYTIAEDQVLNVAAETKRAGTEHYSNHFVVTKLHGKAEVTMMTALRAKRNTPVYIIHYFKEDDSGIKKAAHSKIYFKNGTDLSPEVAAVCDPYDEEIAELEIQKRIEQEANLKNHEINRVKCKNCGKHFTYSPRKNKNCPKCGVQFVFLAEDVEKKWR